jgi:phosphate transport system permease protein
MSTIGSAAAAATVHRSLEAQRPDVWGKVFFALLLLSLLFSLGILAVLLFDVAARAMPVFETRAIGFLTSPLSADPAKAGIAQGLAGTLTFIVLVPLLAFPLGIATAVYLEEYAPDTRLTRLISVNIRNLAGVPSVVYGLLGFTIFVGLFRFLGNTTATNLLAGSLTLSVLVLPIVIITSAEALRAVPSAIREAGYGVGASRWEVTRKLVLPAAAPGILTGTVLSLARALGETAPLLLVGAVIGGFSTPEGSVIDFLNGPYTALPVTVFQWAKESRDAFRQLSAAAIIILLAVTLFANAVAILLRNRFERSW